MPKTLPRGSACLACRRKKMRCDAARPICSNCVKSGGLDCVYDDEPSQAVRRATKLRAYEERIRELESELERVKLDSSDKADSIAVSSAPSTSANPLNITASTWPKDFPPKDMAQFLIQTFYSCAPFAANDLLRQSFESRLMHLPSSSPKFPCSALCHAVFATAYLHLPNKEPQERHIALALQKLNEEDNSQGLMFILERIHAAILISQHMFAINNKGDLFLPVDFAARGCIAFLLNHEVEYPRKWFLKPPESDLEAEQRKRLFFKAYLMDQLFTIETGINPPIIQEEHIFTDLPCPNTVFKRSNFTSTIPRSNEFVYSPNFFTEHPGDGFSLLIKAVVLMGRVNSFLLRCFYYTRALSLSSGSELTMFAELDNLIQRFRQTFPLEFSDPVRIADDGGIDIDNLLAHLMSAHCMMNLHSQWSNETLSQSRLLFYARVTVNSLYKLRATSYDLSRLPPFCLTTYKTAAFILISAFTEAMKLLDYESASTIESEVLTIADCFKTMSPSIPYAVECLSKLESEATKAGISLTTQSSSLPAIAPAAASSLAEWFSPDFGPGIPDMGGLDEYGLLSGASFTTSDEMRWMLDNDLFKGV
ncbi:hypothetical protein E3P99_01477 [Wallemia hederae]|uniref:Zn(2)-C6 fungal-type domain-containing protein n=1 Tax=Wallemia hederae TaxID=1540922 RepID=A0A4T0FQY9_9BASI|nr:hypothetical protein E3P99_01477 [Wallemia hederae]